MILVAWEEHAFPETDPALMRLTHEGLPDPTFGTAGVATTDIPGGTGRFLDAALMGNGKIVATGFEQIGFETYLVVARFLSDGRPDSTFGGGDGLVLITSDSLELQPTMTGAAPLAAVLADGRVLVAGQDQFPSSGWVVIRFTANGALDTTFADHGRAAVEFVGGGGELDALRVQQDGRIVLTGAFQIPGSVSNLALARLHPDGSPDLSFDEDGRAFTPPVANQVVNSRELILLPDGKLLVVASADHQTIANIPRSLALLRYHPDGSLDSAFGGDGMVLVSDPVAGFDVRAGARQADGRILAVGLRTVGGLPNFDSFVARFTPDGELDTSFGPTGSPTIPGIVITDVGQNTKDWFTAVAVQPDGRIIAAGMTDVEDPFSDAGMSAVRYFAGEPLPVPVMDRYDADEDTPISVPAPGVLANDFLLSTGANAALVGGPAHGAVTVNADGSFTYVPAPDYNGPDSFTYRLTGTGVSAQTAAVLLTVRSVNDIPLPAPDQYTLPAVGPLSVPAEAGVLANDTDVEGSPLTAALVDPPPAGALTLYPDGSFSYDCPEDFFGSLAFTYTASDGTTTSAPTTVSLHRGSSVTVNGETLEIVGSPGLDFVRLRPGLGNAVRVEMQTPDGITRTTLKPPPGTRRFTLVDVYLADGDDRLDATGLPIPQLVSGGRGGDYLRTGTRADRVIADPPDGTGTDVIETGPGNDTVTAGLGGSVIDAGAGNDEVTAAGGRNWIDGGLGNDALVGGAGVDALFGGAGKDLLAGGLGADLLDAGFGNDILFDGTVTVKNSAADSLAKVLASFVPSRRSSLVNITGRIEVAFDAIGTDNLTGGLGVDWFWTMVALDVTDRLPAEPFNAVN